MPERYHSPALRDMPAIALHGAPLIGIEARIYNRLTRAMLKGKLRPGLKLYEDQIGETFGVSRTVVRKVLVIMEQQGLVTLPANRGAYVAMPEPEEASAVLEAEQLIASHVVSRLAAPGRRMGDGDRERLHDHMEAQAIADRGSDFAHVRLLAGEFLILLAYLDGNCALAGFFETVAMRGNMALNLYQVAPAEPANHAFQEKLTRQIFASDQAGAVASIRGLYRELERSLRFDRPQREINLKEVLSREV